MAANEDLVDYLQSRAGRSLRAVGRYDEEGCQLIYRRDDLPREGTQERLEALRTNLTWEWNPPKTPALEELGGEQASLQIREQTVILHLPVEADHGLLIGLEPGAARDLTSFITDCMQHVDGINAPA